MKGVYIMKKKKKDKEDKRKEKMITHKENSDGHFLNEKLKKMKKNKDD